MFLLLLANLGFCFNVSELRGFDTSKFSDYPEIGGIRQNLILAYYSQGKENLAVGFPEFSDASLEFMKRFSDAHSLSSTENPDSLLKLPEAVRLASEAQAKMESLSKDSAPLSKFSAYLARSALERYTSTEAEKLKSLADSEQQTRKKLTYYEAAAGVFESSGTGVRAAEMKATYESIRASYEADMESADAIFLEAGPVCNQSVKTSGDWFGLPAYANLRRCTGELGIARRAYVSHLEYERIAALDSQLAVGEKTLGELSGRVVWFFVFLMLIFLALNALVVSRVREWFGDTYDMSLGSEVLMWKERR